VARKSSEFVDAPPVGGFDAIGIRPAPAAGDNPTVFLAVEPALPGRRQSIKDMVVNHHQLLIEPRQSLRIPVIVIGHSGRR